MIKTEIVNGVLRFPGHESVKRFPDYIPKWVDLDEYVAASQTLTDESEQKELLDYASKFGLVNEMRRVSTEIFSAYLGRKLSEQTEEFLKGDNR